MMLLKSIVLWVSLTYADLPNSVSLNFLWYHIARDGPQCKNISKMRCMNQGYDKNSCIIHPTYVRLNGITGSTDPLFNAANWVRTGGQTYYQGATVLYKCELNDAQTNCCCTQIRRETNRIISTGNDGRVLNHINSNGWRRLLAGGVIGLNDHFTNQVINHVGTIDNTNSPLPYIEEDDGDCNLCADLEDCGENVNYWFGSFYTYDKCSSKTGICGNCGDARKPVGFKCYADYNCLSGLCFHETQIFGSRCSGFCVSPVIRPGFDPTNQDPIPPNMGVILPWIISAPKGRRLLVASKATDDVSTVSVSHSLGELINEINADFE